MENTAVEKKIVIVGGGFAGIKCALTLKKAKLENTKIVLISSKPHFEYHAALYRVVTGHSPLQVCIPLCEIFEDDSVEVIEDTVVSVDLKTQKMEGRSGSHYTYDYLVLGLGSETAYFNIPGLEEYSFGFKSITEALQLKNHIHETLSTCSISKEDKSCAAHFVVVGAGASGTELAAELALYLKKLAPVHGVDPSLITIDLIDAAPRILPLLPEDFAKRVEKKLRELGINIYLNRGILKDDVDRIVLPDMEMKAKTLIWTAGVMANQLYKKIEGLEFNKRGQVSVTNLSPNGFSNVFIVGDGAQTQYSGMAQTALYDGVYAGKRVINSLTGRSRVLKYKPPVPVYVIPIGANWAGVLHGKLHIYGLLGWWVRRLYDLEILMGILPFTKALRAFNANKQLCEICSVCCASDNI